ncbi:LysR family transcriptional regulator, partial [Anaerotignum faecicola]|nr:LysR family transcriptional regulator [Anaerotignum faecicola]
MMLEEDLGVRLLNRGARKAELTEAGAYLYSRARDILSMMDTAASELQNFPSSAKGILKLGTISSSGDYLADRVLPGFCRLHPNVRFEISEGNTYELLEKLKNGIIECAVVRTPFNTEGLHCVFGTE